MLIIKHILSKVSNSHKTDHKLSLYSMQYLTSDSTTAQTYSIEL